MRVDLLIERQSGRLINYCALKAQLNRAWYVGAPELPKVDDVINPRADQEILKSAKRVLEDIRLSAWTSATPMSVVEMSRQHGEFAVHLDTGEVMYFSYPKNHVRLVAHDQRTRLYVGRIR